MVASYGWLLLERTSRQRPASRLARFAALFPRIADRRWFAVPWYLEVDFAYSASHRPGFLHVGMVPAFWRCFVETDAYVLLLLKLYRCVDDGADQLWQDIQVVFSDLVQ